MKLETTPGEKLAMLQVIHLMQLLEEKGILTEQERHNVLDLAKYSLMKVHTDEFQDDMK